MKTKYLVRTWVACLAMATLIIGTAVFAQFGPGDGRGGRGGQRGPGMGGFPGPMGPPPAVFKATDNAVYLLAGPQLVKYNTKLEKVGSVNLRERVKEERPGRPRMIGPAEMLIASGPKGEQRILVVMGNEFFNIDSKLEIRATGKLPEMKRPEFQGPMGEGFGPQGEGRNQRDQFGGEMAPPPAPGGEMMPPPPGEGPGMDEMGPPPAPGGRDGDHGRMGNPAGPGGFGPGRGPQGWMPGMGPMPFGGGRPQLELRGNTLYILRDGQLAAINVTDGKLIGLAALPRPQGMNR